MKYEILIVLNDKFNSSELKIWSFNFGRNLKRLNASDILLMSRGKRKLNYLVKNKKRGNFIQVNFQVLPEYIDFLSKELFLDTSVLRFIIFNISKKQKSKKIK